MEESIKMLQFAQDQWYYGRGEYGSLPTITKLEDKNTDYHYIVSIRDKLLEELSRNEINVNIHLGAEVFFDFNLLEILDNPLVTFENSKYMLIEFQMFMMPEGFENELFKLKMHGITPIIAHPERYKQVQNNISIIEKLINSGCLMQIDGGSLIGHFGPKCKDSAEKMLKHNMVHIIGSDSHGMGKNFKFLSKRS